MYITIESPNNIKKVFGIGCFQQHPKLSSVNSSAKGIMRTITWNDLERFNMTGLK